MSAADAVARTNLDDLLTELCGAPAGHGRNQRWHCPSPNHDDEHPSTTTFEDAHGKQRFKCWSCGCCGTAIDALTEARGLTVADAINILEERTGSIDQQPTPRRTNTTRAAPVVVPLSDAAANYIDACAARLWTPAGSSARTWLHGRGLSDDTLKRNLVGFDPGPRRLDRAEGLPGNMTSPERPTPRLPGGRGVTYVAFDTDGDPVHVQCRLLKPPAGFKYVNPRREHGSIPAVSFPQHPTSRAHPVLLVTEGVPDGLIAVEAGCRAAAVTSATTISPATITHIANAAADAEIVIAFDADPAGRTAARRLQAGLPATCRVLQLPDGSDLTDTYQPPSPGADRGVAYAI